MQKKLSCRARGPYRRKVFEDYVYWSSFPVRMRGEDPEKLRKIYNITDEEKLALLQIHNQEEFAERFGISQATLSRWNKRSDIKSLKTLKQLHWMQSLYPNVVLSLYINILKNGTAKEVELFAQLIENYCPPRFRKRRHHPTESPPILVLDGDDLVIEEFGQQLVRENLEQQRTVEKQDVLKITVPRSEFALKSMAPLTDLPEGSWVAPDGTPI